MTAKHATDPQGLSASLVSSHLDQEKSVNLYDNLVNSIVISAIIALILSLGHCGVVGQAEIIAWNLILYGVLCARFILLLFWRYTRHSYSADIWIKLFRIGAWTTGMAWGSSVHFLFADASASHQALLAFSIAGVASGSLTSLTLDRWSAIGFVVFAVFPLSVKLYQLSGPVALPMLLMSLLFVFFVLSSSRRAEHTLENTIVKNFELQQLALELREKQLIDNIIRQAQEKFIKSKNGQSSLEFILDNLITHLKSQLGFIGKVEHDTTGKPFMKAMLFRGDAQRELSVKHYSNNHMPERGEIKNIHGLIGAVLSSGKPIISHNLSRDMRSAGLPQGHPPINNFFAIPVYSENEMIALLGLANSSQDYHEEQIPPLAPVLTAIAQFVQTVSHEADHARDKAALLEQSVNTQIILEHIADGIIMINQQGEIQAFNKAAEVIFGYKKIRSSGKMFPN